MPHPFKFVPLVFVLGVAALLEQGCSPAPAPLPPAMETPDADLPDPTATPLPLAQIPLPPRGTVILSDSERAMPGAQASDWLYYQADAADSIQISGAWDGWAVKSAMRKIKGGLYAFYIGGVNTPFGSYEFKFILDGVWEGGANRVLYLNERGKMEQPPQVVSRALIEHPHQIRLIFYEQPEDLSKVEVTLQPDHGAVKLRWRIPEVDQGLSGYQLDGRKVTFVFDPAAYGMNPAEVKSGSVAGSFNGWNATDPTSQLQRQENGHWTVTQDYDAINRQSGSPLILFKFVVNDKWKNPPDTAPNAMLEPGTPHMNLNLPRSAALRPELFIQTSQPMDLSHPPELLLTGAHKNPLRLRLSPGEILESLVSDRPMGVTLDRENNQTIYRLFAPRARGVKLGLFEGPYYLTEAGDGVAPKEVYDLERDKDGVWEHVQPGLNIGQYYAYQADGPQGNGEGFHPGSWMGDPYATAVALAEGNSIVMDLAATPVKPRPKARVAWEDMVIYETHVRHFTQDPSSGVPEKLRGKYEGILATEGTGTGLDHLKALGVNVIQLMPIHEFNNGFADKHDWGYASCFFFAPESSYASRPLEGSQVKEFRKLVDGLHQRGFAVFMDVVYNHIGGINVFNMIDRKYYFRLNPDFTNQNFSGCGNDVASERPMMRKLIVDSVLFWVEEYGIDGFRFDLAELIDDQTLLEIEREIRAKHPHVVLHSEPWSFRGSHKDFLGPTTWGAWNDRFREPAKAFVTGRGDVEKVKQAIRGSVENWTRHPLQSVNYMESHDDHSLVDELTLNPGHDGRVLSDRDERVHKLAATLIFSSLGTPMISEGQAYLRSKHGIRNTYNQGDALNALRWDERNRPHAREVLQYYQQMIAFRLSPQGAALRVKNLPSLDYTRFIETDNPQALGWIVNANNERPGVPAVMVLMNTGDAAQHFEVSLPADVWRQVGDGQSVNEFGIPGFEAIPGGQTFSVSVPAQTAFLYRSGM